MRKTEILRDPVGHQTPDEEIVIGAGFKAKNRAAGKCDSY